jgi:predicted MFS family arabinose efflux permease
MHAYRELFKLPRVASTILLMFLARLPMTAMGILIALHVVSDLERGYVEAGLVGTASTLAAAVGSPLMGRLLDRYGLRRIVAVSGTISALFWIGMPHLSYWALVVCATVAGVLALPAQLLTRQFLTILVPEERRRAAFSLDVVLGEASFIIGPPLAIVVMTQISSGAALTGMGVWMGLTAIVLWVTNLPTRRAEAPSDEEAEPRPPVRSWLNGPLLAALAVTMGAMFTLIGTELSVLAAMREQGELPWTGVVIAVMSVASIAGGLIHGAVRRSLPQSVLAALLGALLIPVGLFTDPWWLLAIALIPMNLMCTPTLASGSEAVSKAAPARAGAEAMGLLGTAAGLGMALGSPVIGFVIDHGSAGWGFVAAGSGGLVLALAGAAFGRHRHSRPAADPQHPARTAS